MTYRKCSGSHLKLAGLSVECSGKLIIVKNTNIHKLKKLWINSERIQKSLKKYLSMKARFFGKSR